MALSSDEMEEARVEKLAPSSPASDSASGVGGEGDEDVEAAADAGCEASSDEVGDGEADTNCEDAAKDCREGAACLARCCGMNSSTILIGLPDEGDAVAVLLDDDGCDELADVCDGWGEFGLDSGTNSSTMVRTSSSSSLSSSSSSVGSTLSRSACGEELADKAWEEYADIAWTRVYLPSEVGGRATLASVL